MCGCVLPKEHVWSRFHRRCRSKRCRRRGRPAWGEEVDAPRLTQPVLTNPGLVLSMTSASRHDHRSHGADEGSEMRRASHSASRQWGWGPLSGGGVTHCMCTVYRMLHNRKVEKCCTTGRSRCPGTLPGLTCQVRQPRSDW